MNERKIEIVQVPLNDQQLDALAQVVARWMVTKNNQNEKETK